MNTPPVDGPLSRSTDVEELRSLLGDRDRVIQQQARRIFSLEKELSQLREELQLLRQTREGAVTSPPNGPQRSTSVTGAKLNEELRSSSSGGRKSQSAGGSPLESPRTPKLVSQNSLSCSRLQRQRSFKNSNDDVIKRSRTHTNGYELSQDLHDKQVEMLERKYGGSLRARRAARTIQRAFRQYCMNRNFQKLRHSVGERRLSKRLSELGRSNTIWTDRLLADGRVNMGGVPVGEGSDLQQQGQQSSLGQDVRKMVAEFEASRLNGGGDQRLIHQMSYDPSVTSSQGMALQQQQPQQLEQLQQQQRGRGMSPKKDRKRLERAMVVDFPDVDPKHAVVAGGGGGSGGGSSAGTMMTTTTPPTAKGGVGVVGPSGGSAPGGPGKPGVTFLSDETNNNRHSYPEMNDSSHSDSSMPPGLPGPGESAVDPHSLDFENLLETSKETDILTDSFHSDSLHSEGSQDTAATLTLGHRPSCSSLGSSSDYSAAADSARGSAASFESFRMAPDPADYAPVCSNDVQIRVDLASPEDTRLFEQQQQQQQQGIPTPSEQMEKYYMMSKQVKMRQRRSEEEAGGSKPPGVVPVKRTPETSPIWKRKGGGAPVDGGDMAGGVAAGGHGGPPGPAPATGVNGSMTVARAEVKRMSNISETSEADSNDGQCSSSPSSENISTENISISSENSISYQRRPRDSVTPDNTLPRTSDKLRKRVYRIGLNLFNKKPEKGLNFLVERGFIDGSARNVAKFFIMRKGLSKQMIGEFLGTVMNPFNMEVLHYFCQEIDLSGLSVDVALRKFQSYFRMPGEAQKIERLMEAFANRYCEGNVDQVKNFKNPDTVFLLSYAIIMLNTDLHNSNIKPERRMRMDDFIKNLRGIDDGEDLDRDYLASIYERIKAQEFRPGVDHVTQVMKVESTIVGKKPQLSLTHRRLVCYCRLYEVHDPNKKEKIGLHQREVFLFNDLLLITKIFSKKKTGITYTYKNSYSLCGLHIFLFETPHYQYGVQLTSSLDKKILMTFNARNDHDRQKFVEDLQEAILETNGMEQLRIEEELQRHRKSHNTLDKHYANDDSRVLMYEHLKASDTNANRLSAPECGLKKHALSNSLTDLCEAQGMKRGSSGASLDSGVVSGSVGSTNSREDVVMSQRPPYPHRTPPQGPPPPHRSASGSALPPLVPQALQGIAGARPHPSRSSSMPPNRALPPGAAQKAPTQGPGTPPRGSPRPLAPGGAQQRSSSAVRLKSNLPEGTEV